MLEQELEGFSQQDHLKRFMRIVNAFNLSLQDVTYTNKAGKKSQGWRLISDTGDKPLIIRQYRMTEKDKGVGLGYVVEDIVRVFTDIEQDRVYAYHYTPTNSIFITDSLDHLKAYLSRKAEELANTTAPNNSTNTGMTLCAEQIASEDSYTEMDMSSGLYIKLLDDSQLFFSVCCAIKYDENNNVLLTEFNPDEFLVTTPAIKRQ